MSRISIERISKSYGAARAVAQFDLEVEQGELLVFLGPSGCGKTTMLRMIAGFVEPSAGRIRLGARDLTGVPSHARNIGVVFQNYALFPHLSVFENVAFGLRRRRMDEATIRNKVAAALAMVQMDHLATRMPAALSGGQQQRVAVARAIVIEPDVLLLDEPLSNLDARLRLSIRQELRRLQKALGITTILVTHDQEEAMSVADRLVVMSEGLVQQVGTPEEVYSSPANRFVADFIGGANFLSGEAVDGAFRTSGGLLLHAAHLPAGCRSVVIRPERIDIAAAPNPGAANQLPAEITQATFLGAGRLIETRLASGEALNVHVGGNDHSRAFRAGEGITVSIPPASVFGLSDDIARASP